jgi:glycosyltransferase involved in cell wall biosynthesis
MQAVSVIATVLNEVENIPRLVDSLMLQIPPAAEVIVVDGGSTDGTWEWLREAAAHQPALRAIRDETCSLKFTPGPISKGRNIAIAAAHSEVIACADAGCTYAPNWLAELTAPLLSGEAEYALGGASLDMNDPTAWDVASAPFFGVKLDEAALTKSCSARSMAFTKDLWRRLGGFPETVFFGEDTLFDLEARRVASPAFPQRAKALYRPQNSFLSACKQLARYAVSDGILGVRWPRLFRNAARCAVHVLAIGSLPWTYLPLLLVLAMQCWNAFHYDFPLLCRAAPRAIPARFLFSVLVPWIIAANQIRGLVTRKNPTNRQNRQS